MIREEFTRQFDWFLLIILILLLAFGEISIYSASIQKTGEKVILSDYYLKQLIWIFVGIAIFIFVLYIPEVIIDIFVVPFYIGAIFLLLLVLFLPGVKGVHRWINFGGFGLQPSELAKIASVLLIAKIISKRYLQKWKIVVFSFLVILPPILLILWEPDLGSALIFIIFYFPMIYFAGIPLVTIILIFSPIISIIVGFSLTLWVIFDVILLIVLLLRRLSLTLSGVIFAGNFFLSFITPYFWNNLKVYQQKRILTFIEPTRDVMGSGYQTIQSKIAIGSGGIFGKGLLQGTQKNLAFLPEQHTDFIFSVIGEELGFLGCTLLIILFILLVWRVICILRKIQNTRKRITIVGILSFIVCQIVINIGMNIGIFPVVGIPLPFISYGGSNLLVNMVAMGIIVKFAAVKSFIE
ncbi:MAG: rod shape-determining protein RodA [Candidatus Cloacimonadota bacterium]|nr:rod shape-determining protein RodA [Candidatus Cloacimonadota bacterium]